MYITELDTEVDTENMKIERCQKCGYRNGFTSIVKEDMRQMHYARFEEGVEDNYIKRFNTLTGLVFCSQCFKTYQDKEETRYYPAQYQGNYFIPSATRFMRYEEVSEREEREEYTTHIDYIRKTKQIIVDDEVVEEEGLSLLDRPDISRMFRKGGKHGSSNL